MGNIIGQTVVFLKGISKMESDQEKVYGKKGMETLINIKANTNKIKSKVMVYILGKMGAFIKEILRMMLNRDMVKCIGRMEEFIKDNG